MTEIPGADKEIWNELLEQHVFPVMPPCEGFRKNLMAAVSKFIANSIEQHTSPEGFEENAFKYYINIYQADQSDLMKNYRIYKNTQEIRDALELNAISYIGTTVFKKVGTKLTKVNKDLKKIETLSNTLMHEIQSLNVSTKTILAGAFTFEDILDFYIAAINGSKKEAEAKAEKLKTDSVVHRYKNLNQELEFLSSISKKFAKSKIGIWFQVGSRGPKNNSALDIWVTGLAEIWVQKINRSIGSSTDKQGGREQFLNFAEESMFPLHPNLDINAVKIRNTFEKLRENGTFDYLSKKLN